MYICLGKDSPNYITPVTFWGRAQQKDIAMLQVRPGNGDAPSFWPKDIVLLSKTISPKPPTPLNTYSPTLLAGTSPYHPYPKLCPCFDPRVAQVSTMERRCHRFQISDGSLNKYEGALF